MKFLARWKVGQFIEDNNGWKSVLYVILAFVGLTALLVAGFSFGAVLLMCIIIFLIAVFGYLVELAGAIIFVILIFQIGNETSDLLTMWFDNKTLIYKTLSFFLQQGYIKSTVIVFFLLSTMSTITNCIKFFHVNVNNEIKSDKE